MFRARYVSGTHVAGLRERRSRLSSMDNASDSSLIAARLRSLMANDLANADGISRQLGVSVSALMLSIDEASPHPTLEVIVGAVRWYGVDPTWLITGNYDVAGHRTVLTESDSSDLTHQVASLIFKHIPLDKAQTIETRTT